MKLLPYENVNYETELSLEEIRERLAEDLEPEQLIRFFTKTNKKFEGRFSANGFDIRPIIEGRNSFLPMIKGTIYDEGAKRRVNVTMKLHFFVIGFFCIWYGTLVSATGPFLARIITEKESNALTPVILLFYLFPYGLTMLVFKLESEKALNYFEELFEREC